MKYVGEKTEMAKNVHLWEKTGSDEQSCSLTVHNDE